MNINPNDPQMILPSELFHILLPPPAFESLERSRQQRQLLLNLLLSLDIFALALK